MVKYFNSLLSDNDKVKEEQQNKKDTKPKIRICELEVIADMWILSPEIRGSLSVECPWNIN